MERLRSTLIGADFAEVILHLLDVRRRLRHAKNYRADGEWPQ